MVITIHQPEHFPYMGFFQKMAKADLFVILDNVNYRKNYFQNRNKFLNSNNVEEYFTIPIGKDAVKQWIKDVKVSQTVPNWREKITSKLKQNFKIDFSYIYESDSLIDINLKSIEWGMEKLNINTPIVRASDLNVTGEKSKLLANICKTLNATEYISGPSGKDYLELEYFDNIKVTYHHPEIDNYYTCIQNIIK